MKQAAAAILLLATTTLFSQSPKPSIGKQPAWATITTVDDKQTSLDQHAVDGYIILDYEQQVSLAEQSEFVRHTKKIISEAGVQNGSEISVNFDPTYQQLIFHTVQIRRNNQIINKLELGKIKNDTTRK